MCIRTTWGSDENAGSDLGVGAEGLRLWLGPCAADAAVLGHTLSRCTSDSSSPQPVAIRALTQQGRFPHFVTILTSRKVPENICFQMLLSVQSRARRLSWQQYCECCNAVISVDVYNESIVCHQPSLPSALHGNTFSSLDLLSYAT